MAFLQTSKTRAARYDAVVIGSGAAGGMAALTLAKAGAKVLMLEAGRKYDPVTETPMFQTNADAPLRGANTPDKPYGFFDATIGGWVVKDEPYTVKNKVSGAWQDGTFAKRDATDQNFMWWRSRMLGGRTNHWGRVSLRMGPDDFKPRPAPTGSGSTGRSPTKKSRLTTTGPTKSSASSGPRKASATIPTVTSSSRRPSRAATNSSSNAAPRSSVSR